jgi:hypothetical protein
LFLFPSDVAGDRLLWRAVVVLCNRFAYL